MKYLINNVVFFFVIAILNGCTGNVENIIKQINIGLHNNNQLKIQIDVTTVDSAEVYVEYWPDSSSNTIEKVSPVFSNKGLFHSVVLCDIIPKTYYSFHVVTIKNGVNNVSKTYNFQTHGLPVWLQDQFKYTAASPQSLPLEFKNGFMLLNKRETPGLAYIIDYKGRLRWYHTIDGTGLKVLHFTKDKTVLCILGTNDYPTSYGSEILEFNLLGDTILHLKKGQGDFTNTIHHEILKNNKNQLVTIYEDNRVIDLSSVGGNKKDTVHSDGIIVMDTTGKKIWQWSVFDVENPLKDPKILTTKKDWTHANSLNYDKDSNYIISFYNNGQIWKVDSHTGKIIWKFGKGGTIAMPADCDFTQSHAVHINPYGNLMFFDNGVQRQQSEVFAVKLDEQNKTAQMDLHIKLPPDVYNARMGSAYMINDTSILCCCSKRHITVLVNRKGVLLWTLDTAIPPYRVEFLNKEQVSPWLHL